LSQLYDVVKAKSGLRKTRWSCFAIRRKRFSVSAENVWLVILRL